MRRHGPLLLLSILPALVWLLPVLVDPRHSVIGWEGDNLFFTRQFWWVKHSMLDLRISPWSDPNSYWPQGYATTRGDLTLSNTLVALPVTAALGPMAAYNLMLVTGFVLTAFATYAWAWRLTSSRGAALVSAVIAEMSPYRLARAPGHLNVITTQWFSVALWTFEEYLRALTSEGSRHATRWAIGLGLSLGLIALSSWYSAYQASLLIPLYIVLRTMRRRDLWRSPSWYRGLSLAAGISLLTVLPALIPYLRAADQGELTRQFKEMQYWSLNFYDFVIPNANHPLLNASMNVWFHQETTEWVGRAVSLGYVALVLAAIGLIGERRNRDVILPLAAVAIVSASIALGPMLYSGDRPVMVPLSRSAMRTVDWWFARIRPMSAYRAPLWKAQEVWIPLPSLLLWLLIPVTAGMRAMSRFGYWTLLMTAGLAAFGTRCLLDRAHPSRRAIVAAVLTIAVTLESWSIRTVTRWEPRPVDQWIAAQPPNDVVLELPASAANRPAQDFYVTVQQHRTMLGPRGDSYPPAVFFERFPVLLQMPSDTGLAAVRSWGATLVIIDSATVARWPEWEQMFVRAQAPQVARFGDTRVYRLHGSRE